MLPPGVDRIDALLESRDGHVYVFGEGGYWAYSSATYALADPQPPPAHRAVGPPRRAGRASTPRSPTPRAPSGSSGGAPTAPGSRSSAGHRQHPLDRRGRRSGGPCATPSPRHPRRRGARIDAAFVDADGRTYLFSGDQYVRYSGSDYDRVDEGYPRSVAEWWAGEGRQTPLPPRFRGALDAAFQGRDGRLHLFAGDRYLPCRRRSHRLRRRSPGGGGLGPGPQRLRRGGADRRGLRRPARPSAWSPGTRSCATPTASRTTASGSTTGSPRRIESHLRDVPAEFEGGVEAAFVDAAAGGAPVQGRPGRRA